MLHVSFVGNLGADAETNEVDGTPVANFSVAVKPGVKKDEDPIWVRCAFWGKRVENVEKFLVKGKQVMIVGTLTTREFEHKDETRFSLDCRVTELELLGGPKSDEDEKGGGDRPAKKNGTERRASR